MVSDDIQAVVNEVVRERLGNGSDIVSVRAERDEDFDGDKILRVTVIVDSDASTFEPKRLSSLLRFLRPRLAERHETAFPIVSFMSKAEAGMCLS